MDNEPRALSFRPSYTITSSNDLKRLDQGTSSFGFKRQPTVRVALDNVPSDLAAGWEANLNSALAACGCSEGAKTALLFAGCAVLWSWTSQKHPGIDIRTLSTVIPAFIAGGVIGKLIGLRAARRRFQRTLGQIAQRLSDFPSTRG